METGRAYLFYDPTENTVGSRMADWFSSEIRNETLARLHAADLPSTDRFMERFVRRARELAMLRSEEWVTPTGGISAEWAAASGGKDRTQLRLLADSCPDETKLVFVDEVILRQREGLVNDSILEQRQEVLNEVLDGLALISQGFEAEIDEYAKRKVREYLQRLDNARPTHEYSMSELRALVVEPCIELCDARVEDHYKVGQEIQELGRSMGASSVAIAAAERAAGLEGFDLELFGAVEELLRQEVLRLAAPDVIAFGAGFFDREVVAELEVAMGLVYEIGPHRLHSLIEPVHREHGWGDPIPEMLDRAESKLVMHWMGRDQLRIGPQGGNVTAYVNTVLKNVFTDWLVADVPLISTDSPAPAGMNDTDSVGLTLADGLADDDTRPPGREDPDAIRQRMAIISDELADDVEAIFRRTGIEIAGVMSEQPSDLHWKTANNQNEVFELALAVSELQRSRLAAKRFHAVATGHHESEVDRRDAVADVVEVASEAEEHRYALTMLVFDAMKLRRPRWQARYGATIPTSKSAAPSAGHLVDGKAEGADYQELYRRTYGIDRSDVTDPVVRGGVRLLLDGILQDVRHAVHAAEKRFAHELEGEDL